jgi:hypothetical protein
MRLNLAQEEPALAVPCCPRGVSAGASCPGHELRLRKARRDNTPELQDGDRGHAAVALKAGLPKRPSAGLAVLLRERPFPQPCRGVHPGRLPI